MQTELLEAPGLDVAAEPGWWRSVLARDRALDGVFVYAVASTRIYCRPSCPSRRPRPEQVAFFLRPAEAERAGFRPCRRCRPADAADPGPLELVRRVCAVIEAAPDGRPTLADLGAAVGLSPQHMQRVFKRATGLSPRQYAEAHRLERFKSAVKAGADVTGALYDAGYGSSSRLYERAPERLGMTPGAYRRGGAGMAIGFTVVPCPLNLLLVAATERGVCFISMGDREADLEAALRREFPAAAIHRDDAGFREWVDAVVRYLEGHRHDLDLPLDVRATAFRWRVWAALRAIPYGSTRTYGQIALELGQPSASRAVARACATNPVSLAIPCHRVVGADGGLTGYRWGLERKRALLEREGGHLPPRPPFPEQGRGVTTKGGGWP